MPDYSKDVKNDSRPLRGPREGMWKECSGWTVCVTGSVAPGGNIGNVMKITRRRGNPKEGEV